MLNTANTNPAATNPAPATKPAAVDNAAALAEKSRREAAAEERRAREAEAEKREAEKLAAEAVDYAAKCEADRRAEERRAKLAEKSGAKYTPDITRAAEAAKSAREAVNKAAAALKELEARAADTPTIITHPAKLDEAREALAAAKLAADNAEAAAKLAEALAARKAVKGGKSAAVKSAADTAEAEAAAARARAEEYTKAAAAALADYTASEQRVHLEERLTAAYNAVHPIVVNKVITGQTFDIVLLDWFAMYEDVREAIISYVGYDEDSELAVSQDCTATIIIPRNKGILDLNNAFLHISTIGRIDPSDISDFIINNLNGNVYELENPVTLSGSEKVQILSSIIPSIDKRGVI